MNIQLPTQRELQKELTRLKNYIDPDCIELDEDKPSMEITLAADSTGYALQTGDNSFTGPAYGFQHWAVVWLYSDSNCLDLAKDLIEQVKELASY